MAQQIQLRRGTAAAWTSANPTLAVGEPGAETDTGKFKIGDGATAWASLAYSSGAAGADGVAGVVPNAATATLATTHYSAALAARPNPLTDGYAWMQVFAATNPAASDIALSSGTAQPLYSNGAALPAGAIVAGCPYLCRSNGTQVEVLGEVGALALLALHTQYCLTTGSANAYVATPTVPWTAYADGMEILLKFHAANTTDSTVAISGLAAQHIYKRSQAGNVVLVGAELPINTMAKLVYNSSVGGLVIETSYPLKAADIPSTLGATTFSGIITLPTLTGGVELAPASGTVHSIFGTNTDGVVINCLSNTQGFAFSTYANIRAKISSLVFQCVPTISSYTDSDLLVTGGAVNTTTTTKLTLSGVYDGNPSLSAASILHGKTHASYPGAHQNFAPLTTRAASTAIALCPVATGDTAKVELQDDTAGSVGAIVRVDSAGTVTFGYETDAKYVNSSSPAATEIGVYISAGILYMKPGASITPKIASFSKIGKA